MKFLFPSLSFVLFSFFSSAQDLDSLKRSLQIEKNDTIRTQTYIDIGDIYWVKNADSALFYWDKARQVISKILEKAPATIKIALQKQLGNALNNCALANSNKGKIKEALDQYNDALKIYDQVNDPIGEMTALNNVCMIYLGQKEYQKTEQNLKSSLSIAERIHDTIGLALCNSYFGYLNHALGREKEALNYFLIALEMVKRLNNPYQLAYAYQDIGVSYYQMRDFDKTMEYYLKALELREQIGDKQGLSNTLNNLGDLYIVKKDYKKADACLKRALKLGQEQGFPENIWRAAQHLSDVYKATSRYEEALKMHELFYLMKDSMNNQEIRKSTIRSQLKYEYEKKAYADSLSTSNEKKVMRAELKEQETRTYALYGGLAIVSIFLFFLFNRFQVIKKQKQIIERKENETQKQNQVISEQKALVEEKQREILDSINYAKRIQMALMPSEKIFRQKINHNK